jgi:hypothetical protein
MKRKTEGNEIGPLPKDPFEGSKVELRLESGKTVSYIPTRGSRVVHEDRVRRLIDLIVTAPDDDRTEAAAHCLRAEILSNREVSRYA